MADKYQGKMAEIVWTRRLVAERKLHLTEAERAEVRATFNELRARMAAGDEHTRTNLATLVYTAIWQVRQGNIEALTIETAPAPATAFEPPSSVLLALLLPSEVSGDIIANLEEVYQGWVAKYGERKARWIWWTQSTGIVVRVGIAYALTVVDRLKHIKFN